MAEDWDLFAIVRSCQDATFTTAATETPPTTTTTTAITTNTISRSPQHTASCLATFTVNQGNGNGPFSFPNLVQASTSGFQELHQLFMTFNPTTTTTTITSTSTSGLGINPTSPLSGFAGSIGQQQWRQSRHHPVLAPTTHTSFMPHFVLEASTSGSDRFHDQQQQQQPLRQPQLQQNQLQVQIPHTSSSHMVLPNTQSQTPRSRKRKSQQKRMVCHVTADKLSADLWAWRKYGQKPIKGSPYPRNYYRCSSFKGCAARKQVERSTTEPNMFIVTYTGDHKHEKPTHRNSLAGSTRSKPSGTRLPETRESGLPSSRAVNMASSSSSALSPTTPLTTPPKNDEVIAAGETEQAEQETEFDIASDDEDDEILIPNEAAMSDDVFLGLHHFDGGGGDGGGAVSSC